MVSLSLCLQDPVLWDRQLPDELHLGRKAYKKRAQPDTSLSLSLSFLSHCELRVAAVFLVSTK